jgi:hypothetical protein
MGRNPFLAALLDRGVWQAPWLGPDGELVLIAITRSHALHGGPVVVPHGASRVDAADRLWALLERDDPIPKLRVI